MICRAVYRLGDLGRIVTGRTPPKSLAGSFGEGIPFVTPTDMDGRKVISSTERRLSAIGLEVVSRAKIPAGAVLVSCIGSDMGKAAIAGCNCVTNQQINSIVVSSEFDASYVYYNLSTRKKEFQRLASGAAQPILNKTDFSNLLIALPPLSEQRVIAKILGSLDDKIELNRRMNRTLEAMARALFKSWFVDFDPVHANAAGTPTLPPDLAALFPSEFEPSPIGDVPKGWQVKPLGDLLSVLETGRRPKGGVSKYTSGVPSIGAESIWGIGEFDFGKTKFVPDDFYEKTIAGRVEHNDVLLYKDGGKPGVFKPRVGMFGFDFPFDRFCINEHVFRLRSEAVGQIWLYFTVSCERVLDDYANKGGKAAIPGINQRDVKSVLIAVPPKALLDAFEDSARPLCDHMLKNAIQSRTLAALRDSLLPKLLSGELPVASASEAIA